MSFVRWDPAREMEQFFSRPLQITASTWTPPVDVQETAEAYVLHAELPGMKKEDVKVTLDDGVLTVSGERRQEKEEKGRRFHRVERSYGAFARSFTLPTNIDEKQIVAEYKDGVLDVRVPKAPSTHTTSKEIKIG